MPPPSPNRYLLWIVLGMAFVLRLGFCGWTGLNVDEAYGYFVSRASLGDLFRFVVYDNHPPLYYLLLKLFSTFARSEWWLRLPSLTAGVATVWLAYHTFSRLLDRNVALWTAALCAVSYPILVEHCLLRGYSLFCFLFMALVYCWTRDEQGHPVSPTTRLSLSITASLTHMFALGSMALVLLGRRRQQPITHWLAPLLGIGLTGTWILFAASQQQAAAIENVRAGSAPDLIAMPYNWLGLPTLQLWWPTSRHLTIPVSVLSWAALLFGSWRLTRRNLRFAMALILCALAPAAVLFAGGAIKGWGWFQLRLLVAFVPFGLALIVNGVPQVARTAMLGPIVLLNLWMGLQIPVRVELHLQAWDRVSNFVRAVAQPGDRVVFYLPYSSVAFNFYYPFSTTEATLRPPWQFEYHLPPGNWPQQRAVVPEMLTPQLHANLKQSPVVLVLNQESDPRVREWFAQHFGVTNALEISAIDSMGNISAYRLLPRVP